MAGVGRVTASMVVAVSLVEANRLLPTEVHDLAGLTETYQRLPVQSVLSLLAPVEDGCTIGLLVDIGLTSDEIRDRYMPDALPDESKFGGWVLVGEVTVKRYYPMDYWIRTGGTCASPPLAAPIDPSHDHVIVLDPARAVRYPTPQNNRGCPNAINRLVSRRP